MPIIAHHACTHSNNPGIFARNNQATVRSMGAFTICVS